jgi:hypothetical protein
MMIPETRRRPMVAWRVRMATPKARSRPGTFGASLGYAPGTRGGGLAMGDFDGDGRLAAGAYKVTSVLLNTCSP